MKKRKIFTEEFKREAEPKGTDLFEEACMLLPNKFVGPEKGLKPFSLFMDHPNSPCLLLPFIVLVF